jgi:hypothetical protein
MKRILALISVLAAIAVLIIPSGVAVADQAYHTDRLPFHSLNLSDYPLKQGFMINIHMNGPNNFEKKEFQLNGAKPNTEFFIYRRFEEAVYNPQGVLLIPKGAQAYSGYSILTDEHGNGHCELKLAPDDLVVVRGVPSLYMTVVLYEGMRPGGIPAYETEAFRTFLDWKW